MNNYYQGIEGVEYVVNFISDLAFEKGLDQKEGDEIPPSIHALPIQLTFTSDLNKELEVRVRATRNNIMYHFHDKLNDKTGKAATPINFSEGETIDIKDTIREGFTLEPNP